MQQLPLFPLNLFLLPGDYRQLYIFEERYKQLVNESWEQGRNFGLPFSNKLNDRNYGTAVVVHSIISEEETGEMEIIVKATGTFRLDKFYNLQEGKLFPYGEVSFFNQSGFTSASTNLVEHFKKHLLNSQSDDGELLALKAPSIYDIAGVLNLSDIDKMEFVSLGQASKMEHYLINYFRYLEIIQEQEEHVFQNFYLN
jgi:Lon protease-like protein